MAGGVGARLWPVSNSDYPKQFIKMFDNFSMLQKTLLRNKIFGKSTVIINKEYKDILISQAKEINIEVDIILEPLAKNTAPCAIIASLKAIDKNFRYVLLVPADHHIEGEKCPDDNSYVKEIEKAVHYAANGIVTLGIKPDFASTSYGYIETCQEVGPQVYKATKFVEKPNFQKANIMLGSTNCFWNSGIFIYDVEFMLRKAALLQPELHRLSTRAYNNARKFESALELDYVAYKQMPSISFDFAIMEYLTELILVEVNFIWYDLGNWHSIWAISNKDEQNNYFIGDVIANNVTNSYVSSENKTTALLGLDDVIVVNTKDVVFIADKSRAEEVRQFTAHNSVLNAKAAASSNIETKITKIIHDWGYYQIIDDSPSYKIKKLILSVKAKLALRAKLNVTECWVVLQGKVKILIADKVKYLTVNDYILISPEQICNLINIGQTELHLIKIQTNYELYEHECLKKTNQI